MKSKRAVLVEPKRFEFETAEVNPKPSQVMIKIAACGLCNWELNHWKGIIGPCPLRLGHEWSGVVEETGSEVTKFKPGDRVTVLSSQGFSEYAVAEENLTFKLADSVNLEYALGEPLKCIITVMRAVAPEAGAFGVVFGCGRWGFGASRP
jgi:D-arabinose 1-dehydrogenase-like Zn-dependent alcohol dehydrogenase